jgi:hypothetical protein
LSVITAVLPSLSVQAERLITLGVHELAGLSAPGLRARVAAAGDGLLVLPGAAASALAPLLRYRDRPGFVVEDLTDVDDFLPTTDAALPDADVYLVQEPRRHDELRNWSPAEALPHLLAAGRTPLTLAEGIFWLLQSPDVLERGACFMTIGSRLRRPDGSFDARTPALWISNGTGRDGRANRDAPKLGWCWWGNRHTWLGFVSGAARPAL